MKGNDEFAKTEFYSKVYEQMHRNAGWNEKKNKQFRILRNLKTSFRSSTQNKCRRLTRNYIIFLHAASLFVLLTHSRLI